MREPFLLLYGELRRLSPRGKAGIIDGIVAHSSILAEYSLTKNKLRLCHFLAQAAHETAGFRTLVEYGSTRYFDHRYGHRQDLGNRKRSDGSRYRGRGIFQLTGRANYRRFGHFLGIDLEANPLLASDPEISLRIACEYWQRHSLSVLADRNDLHAITRKINGGYNGLRDRQRYFKRALSIWLPDSPFSTEALILQIGDRGADVRRLQKMLRATGRRIMVDGLFGHQTYRVLKNFQRKHHLRPDGLFGPRSKRLLARISDKARKDKPLKTTIPPVNKPKETIMDQWKSYLSSRTIWANFIGFGALALDIFGFNGVSAQDQSQLVDQLLKLVEAGGFIAGVVFRALARDRLGPHLF